MTTQTYLAYDFPLLSVLWTMLAFALWVLWFFLLFKIIFDIFRDDDLNGWAKAGWLAFVVLLPFLGVFVYLIVRGKGMGRRDLEQAREQRRQMDTYVRETAVSRPSAAEELAKLAAMRDRGDITEADFQRAKELVLTDYAPQASAPPTATPPPGDGPAQG
ncbi:PLD nuclease N-terminal domain-containing protein [Streptomyces sp. NPDC059104]|uniref:PLD nuclease N-terminal domain-containing protein n=1 Tax=Streptomyces sp. NPDC059104 TaxID=3346729 RepID=UPI00368002CE